jgi:hypothetical protein
MLMVAMDALSHWLRSGSRAFAFLISPCQGGLLYRAGFGAGAGFRQHRAARHRGNRGDLRTRSGVSPLPKSLDELDDSVDAGVVTSFHEARAPIESGREAAGRRAR